MDSNIIKSTTRFSSMAFSEIENEAITPDIPYEISYMDADEELQAIAQFIKNRCAHNGEVETDRIKFLYSNKPKKEGGKYVAGYIMARSEIERIVDDRYDYIVCVYFPVWQALDVKHKVIQLDKLLCGIQVDVDMAQNKKVKKNQADIREFSENVNYFGADEVIDSSNIINLATEQVLEEIKEAKKNG